MNVQAKPNLSAAQRLFPFERVALVLQGGGALGAYQAGVYEALAESSIHPDWIAGISIGGINGAIIAGNPPNMRVDRLREFWTQVTSDVPWNWFGWAQAKGDGARNLMNHVSANAALMQGASGFFTARPLSPWLQPSGTTEATSFYDTRELKRTLERLVDFDRLNAGLLRFSVGAVNVRTGNLSTSIRRHTRSKRSTSWQAAHFPPGFPAIEIEGEQYWDGGLVSSKMRDGRPPGTTSRAPEKQPGSQAAWHSG